MTWGAKKVSQGESPAWRLLTPLTQSTQARRATAGAPGGRVQPGEKRPISLEKGKSSPIFQGLFPWRKLKKSCFPVETSSLKLNPLTIQTVEV